MVDVVLRGGRNFKGLGVYLLEGARGKPRPAHALGEILYLNLPAVREPRHAFGIMAATARDADALKQLAGIGTGGRPGEKPVYHFTLSWSLEERVTEEQAHAAAEEALLELELEDRQAVVIVHRDTDHLHVHVAVNRVSPEDGRFAGMGRDQIKLSRWAKGWEQRTFGRTFCRRPDRDENLCVDPGTYNQHGNYPIRFRTRKRPERDEHRREEWRRLLSRQRAELDAAKKAGGDVAALEKKQKTERVKLALELRRMEEQRQPEDTNRVDPKDAAAGATSGHDRAPDTADAAKAQATDKPAPANNVSESAQRSPELEAPRTLSGPADETLPVPIPEPGHAREVEHVEATDRKPPSTAGGDVSALERQQEIERVQLSRTEEQRRLEDPKVDPIEAATGATSGHDRAPNRADVAKAPVPEKPVPVNNVSEPAQRSPELEAPRTPSGPADETRPVPISEPAHVPEVERVEAAEIKQTTATTADKTPTPQAVQRRTAQQSPEPAGPIRIPAKSVDRDPPRDRSGGSSDQRDQQESRPASPVVPPQQTRRDEDSRPRRKLEEQPRAKEQRPATDVNGSAGRKTGGAVKRMHDRPVEATGRPMKHESDGHASISKAAGPVRNGGAGSAASPVRTGLPTPPAAADETRAAPIADPARARAVSGGKATGTGQTDATAAGAVPARPAAQPRMPAQARKSADSHPPPAKPADTVLPDGKPGRVVDRAQPPKSTSTSPKATAATSAETRSDDVQPPAVCLKDYGREPAAAVAMVAAAAGFRLARSRAGRRHLTGSPHIIVDVPTMSTPDAQHAIDLMACAMYAPQLRELDDKQQFATAAAAVAQGLADRLGTRKTFDSGCKQVKQLPLPPASATLRNMVRRAVDWFVERLRQFIESRRNERRRTKPDFRPDLMRIIAGGGTTDDPAGTVAGRAAPMTTPRNHPRRTRAGVTTPRASGGLVDKAGAASPKSHRTGSRTPPIAASGRLPAKSDNRASLSAASGCTDDRRRLISSSSPTAPTATPTPPAGTPERVRPAPQVKVPSIGQVTPKPDTREAALGGDSRPHVSQAAHSSQSSQSVSARTGTPTGVSPGQRAVRRYADEIAQGVEADLPRRVPAGTLALVREAAGDHEDVKVVVDALTKRAESAGDGPERERAESEHLEHLPEVKARTQLAKPEPEQSSSWWKRCFGSRSEPSKTTTPAPDPSAVLEDARRRYVHELLEIISRKVHDTRERLEAPSKSNAATSRSLRDERWRVGLEPIPDHDRNQQPGRW